MHKDRKRSSIDHKIQLFSFNILNKVIIKLKMEKEEIKPVEKKKKGPCWVWKKTKTIRDEWIINNGEDKCIDFIRAHNQCLIQNGFRVESDII